MSRAPRDAYRSLLRKLGADLGTTALGAVGFGLALGSSRWGFLALALALAGIAGRLATMRHNSPRQNLLGVQPAQRALLGAGTAAAVALASTAPGQGWIAGLGAVVLVGGLMYEQYLRPGLLVQAPVVANLPGIEQPPPERDLSRQTVVADLAAAATGLLVGLLAGSPWWWVLAALVTLVPRLAIVADNRARAAHLKHVTSQLGRAVEAYQPELAVYTSWPEADGAHQVTMWLPYLQRTGRRCMVVTRSPGLARALAPLVEVPVVEARGPEDLDTLTTPSLKAAFYPNASAGNGVFVRYPQLTHVFLGHGDSDKPTSFNPTHAMYDRIFCAGPAAVRRYAEHGVAIAPEKFVVVGRPQVEAIRPATSPVAATQQPVVLYAPTWRGHVQETAVSSLPVGEQVVQGLLAAGATVIFRPHPFSYGFRDDVQVIRRIHALLAADSRSTGRPHRWGAAAESELSVDDCFNASDALVSDVSSVVSDYLFSAKPYAMVAMPSAPGDFRASYPVARAAYVIRGDLADLEQNLGLLLGADPLADVRRDQRADYLGPFPAEGYASAFLHAVNTVVGAAPQHRESDDSLDDAVGSTGPTTEAWDGELAGSVAAVGPSDATTPGEPRPARPSRNRRRSTRLRRLRRRLDRPRRYNQAGALLALFALLSALAGQPAALSAGLGVASLAGIYWSVRPTVRRRKRWHRLLAESRATRVVLICAAVAASTPARSSWLTATVAVVLLSCAVTGEAHVMRAWSRKLGLQVHNLPVLRTVVTDPVPRGLLPLVSSAAILLALVAPAANAPAEVLLVLAVLVFGLFAVVTTRAMVRAARVVRAEYELKGALTAYAPEFAVYFASTVGAGYQIGMWAPYFARIGRPFVVVTRAGETLGEITRALRRHGVEVPVIHRPTLRGLEDVMVPSMTTAFYVNNAARNTHFIERRELTHVWLNHGDSEKPACYNPVHAIYDLIFVAGQAGVERYARHGVSIPSDKFRIVGRPQVEVIEQPRARSADQPPTILYAPTWQGPYADTRLFSLPVAVPLVEQLLAAGARVIFRAHPLNYQFPSSTAMIKKVSRLLARHRHATGVEHLWGPKAERAITIEDCFNASDAMIADVSAVVSDYLHSDKPFAIVAVGRSVEELTRDAPAARAGYLLREDLSNLPEVLADMLGADPLSGVRKATRVHYLGDFDREHYADAFLQAARTVIDARTLAERQSAAALSTGE